MINSNVLFILTAFCLSQTAHAYKDIATIIDCFAGKNTLYEIVDFLDPIKLITFERNGQVFRFFGVEKDRQDVVDFPEFKAKVTEIIGTQARHAIEVVGDSAQFSATGSDYVRNFLRKRFSGNHLIEYGFTGYVRGKELDINSFINEYVDENPSEAYKVIGNVLGHTHTALHKWGTNGSRHVCNFVVVYNNDGMSCEPEYDINGLKICGFTTFGDDIVISDKILQAHDDDRMVCVEGGVQSFRQVMNALCLGIPVELVYNVRKSEREPFFSTARFLLKIRNTADYFELTENMVQQIYDDYNVTLQSVWDVSKPDYLTKKALFENAIQDFIHSGIYKNVGALCSFHNAKQ